MHARARLDVRDELLQPFGIIHGGVLSTLVESICSLRDRAGASTTKGWRRWASRSTSASCARSPRATTEVHARARHRGRTTWVWEAEVRDSEDRALRAIAAR